MASRRKQRTELSADEQERFLAANTALHRAIVEPLIAPQSEHYQALRRVHSALLTGIEEVTGALAPWARQSSR